MELETINSWIIEECIDKWESEFHDSECEYGKCLDNARLIGLTSLVNPSGIVKQFLYKWGGMGRVLGRSKYLNWENVAEKQININIKGLMDFKNKELFDTDLDEYEPIIKRCYESFEKAVGSIAAAKTLHLICPNFFPLWDNAIADSIRNERLTKKKPFAKNYLFSPEDYSDFMKDIQNFAKRNNQILSELELKYNTTKIRIIDEFLWWMTHRPLSRFF